MNDNDNENREFIINSQPEITEINSEIQSYYRYNPYTNEVISLNPLKVKELNITKSILIKEAEKRIFGDIRLDSSVNIGDVNIEEIVNSIVNTLRNKVLEEGEQYLLTANNTYYTLSNSTLNKLIEYLEDQTVLTESQFESDQQLLTIFEELNSIDIQKINQQERNDMLRQRVMGVRIGGAFFNKVLKEKYNKIDLSKYEIFNNINCENYTDNCLVVALKNGGLDEKKLNILRHNIFFDIIPKCKLNEISERLRIRIKLKALNSNGKIDKVRYYPTNKELYNKFEEEYNIGNINNHYFINDKTNYTKYSIENYDDIKDIENFNYINQKKKKYYEKNKNRTITSFKLIKLMMENKEKYFNPILYNKEIIKTIHENKLEKIGSLEYDKNNLKKIELYSNKYKTDKEEKEYINIFFDFETYKNKDNINLPYLCCYVSDDGRKKTFYGKDCGLKMLFDLNKLYENVLLIAHNVSFDFNYIIRHLRNMKIIKRINQIISCSAVFGKKNKLLNIKLKDSYALITMPLRKFGKTFNLEQGKEVMPYRLYDEYYNQEEELKDNFIEIKKGLKYLEENEKELFIENIKKWKLDKGDRFNLIEYSALYCMIDCEVLKEGYNTFRGWINEVCEIDINKKLTLASLADNFFIKEKSYDKCFQMSGVVREFIQRCVVGGRVMCNSNNKIRLDNCKIADFDAVSLYPSAMERLSNELGGILIGKPKILQSNQLHMNFLNSINGYFIEIEILKIGIKRDFPLLSIKGTSRNFTNEIVGKKFYIDKISLEDCIKFHKIEFKILRGYYYDEGRDPKIGEVIRHIFNARLEMKKIKNPAQLIYKLLMNSAYGKTIQKPIKIDSIVITGIDEKEAYKKLIKYIKINYNFIKKITKISDNIYQVKKHKSILEHFNRAHIGVEILSASKRIMNEVMCLAEDKGIKIYYMDTDSMQLNKNKVPLLAKYFQEEYGKELIGKNLSQFHIDYELKGALEETIVGVNAYYLGKKVYFVELEGKDKKGKKIRGSHIRCKGVNESTLRYKANQLGISIKQLYINLYEGKKYDFDLLEGGNAVKFEFKDYTVLSRKKFTRSLHFPDK
jgi:hypothetical protein